MSLVVNQPQNVDRRGIILAGGSGTRLYPITKVTSKQLLPVYDKPMIYYPLSTLMQAGMREIIVITTPHEQHMFQDLLEDGTQWGLKISYAIQPKPEGLAQALILSKEFLGGRPSCLILGDNIFHGSGIAQLLATANARTRGATVFGYRVSDARRYGVVEMNTDGQVLSIEEKPEQPKSNYAVTGLYFYDEKAPEYAANLEPSKRGELEITDLNRVYLEKNRLHVERMGRGYAWLDTGTHDSLQQAASFIETIEARQGLRVSCPEEIAYRQGWINREQLMHLAEPLVSSGYGQYLRAVADSAPEW